MTAGSAGTAGAKCPVTRVGGLLWHHLRCRGPGVPSPGAGGLRENRARLRAFPPARVHVSGDGEARRHRHAAVDMRRRRADISAESRSCQLNSRFTSGNHVRLLCSPVAGGLRVSVFDQGNCGAFHMAVRDRERALDVVADLDAYAVLDRRENGA